MGVTVDTAFIVDYLRRDRGALAKSAELDRQGAPIFLTAPALFEVLTGLVFSRSRLEGAAFRALARAFTLLPFDEAAAERAALIQADLLRAGRVQSKTDVMIAAIAAVHGHSLVTRGAGFNQIAASAGLRVVAY